MLLRAMIAAMVLLAAGPARAELKVVSKGPGLLLSGDRYDLHSDALGRDMIVTVIPPLLPLTKDQKVPTIYALDGGYGVAGPIAAELAGADAMAPALTVEVEYPSGQWSHRNDDLLYERSYLGGHLQGGGAPAFERFLVDELKPWIEARYPADPARAVLFGHSDGGVFAAEMIVRRPHAFSGYVIGSPAVKYEPDLPARVEAAAASLRGTRIYLAVGGAETPAMVAGERALARALTGPGSTAIVRERTYPGERHLTYYPRLASDALPWILPLKGLPPIPAAALAEDVGAYLLADGRRAAVVRRGGQGFITIDRDIQRELLVGHDGALVVPGTGEVVGFADVRGGHARIIVVTTGARQLSGRRIGE